MAFVRQHFQRIFAVRRPLHNIPIGHLGVEHGETIMMARGDGDVLHPRRLGQRDPRFRVKLFRVEKFGQLVILLQLELTVMKYPLPVSQNAIHAPVNEHAKFVVLELLPRFQIFR